MAGGKFVAEDVSTWGPSLGRLQLAPAEQVPQYRKRPANTGITVGDGLRLPTMRHWTG